MYVSHRDQNWLACQNRKGVEESGNAMDENIPSEEDLLRNGNHGANRVKVGTLLDSLEDHGAELPQVHFGTVQPATQFCAQKEIAPWHLSQSHWLNTCNENKKKNWYGQTGISSNSLGVIARNPEGSWVRTSYNRGWVYTLSAKWISDRGYWIDSSFVLCVWRVFCSSKWACTLCNCRSRPLFTWPMMDWWFGFPIWPLINEFDFKIKFVYAIQFISIWIKLFLKIL